MWKLYESRKNKIYGQFFTFLTKDNNEPTIPIYCFAEIFHEIISIPDSGLFIVEKAYCMTTYCPYIEFFTFLLSSLHQKSIKIEDANIKDVKEFFTRGFGDLINQFSNISTPYTGIIDTLLKTKYQDFKGNEIPSVSSMLGLYKFPYDIYKFKTPFFKNWVLCEYFIESVLESISLDAFYELLIGVILELHVIFVSKCIPKISAFR
jgi:hypothetical protein